jgi:hypothetical protein
MRFCTEIKPDVSLKKLKEFCQMQPYTKITPGSPLGELLFQALCQVLGALFPDC